MINIFGFNIFISTLYKKPLKKYINVIKNKKKLPPTGKIFFQHKSINWSKRYLGNKALTIINKQAINITFAKKPKNIFGITDKKICWLEIKKIKNIFKKKSTKL